jgi:ubiquitin-like-conjugating enzyme ATG3
MVDKLKYGIYKNATDFAAKYMLPTLKESKFLEKGVLTPEEFVVAGEHLTHKCNTWRWESGKEGL